MTTACACSPSVNQTSSIQQYFLTVSGFEQVSQLSHSQSTEFENIYLRECLTKEERKERALHRQKKVIALLVLS
jgi:hypothetical protein